MGNVDDVKIKGINKHVILKRNSTRDLKSSAKIWTNGEYSIPMIYPSNDPVEKENEASLACTVLVEAMLAFCDHCFLF